MSDLVEELSSGGEIVELGCGEGALIGGVDPTTYGAYQGFDISAVAVQHAQERALEAGLDGCRFSVGELADWPGASGLSLVVIEECLYYLEPAAQRRLLERCFDSLTPDGRVLVAVHSKIRHAATLGICREVGEVDRELDDGERVILVLARRSRGDDRDAPPEVNRRCS